MSFGDGVRFSIFGMVGLGTAVVAGLLYYKAYIQKGPTAESESKMSMTPSISPDSVGAMLTIRY